VLITDLDGLIFEWIFEYDGRIEARVDPDFGTVVDGSGYRWEMALGQRCQLKVIRSVLLVDLTVARSSVELNVEEPALTSGGQEVIEIRVQRIPHQKCSCW